MLKLEGSLTQGKAGLETTQSWEEWFVHQMVVLPFRRTLSVWRNWLTDPFEVAQRGEPSPAPEA